MMLKCVLLAVFASVALASLAEDEHASGDIPNVREGDEHKCFCPCTCSSRDVALVSKDACRTDQQQNDTKTFSLPPPLHTLTLPPPLHTLAICPTPFTVTPAKKRDVCEGMGRLCDGLKVSVTGRVCRYPDRFNLNLLTDDGFHAFHFDSRFTFGDFPHRTLANSRSGEYWGWEVVYDKFPFARNAKFDIQVTFKNNSFDIVGNGVSIGSFPLRAPFKAEEISKICVFGCASVDEISVSY